MCIFAAGVAYARNHFHFVQIRFSVSVSAYSIPIDGSITSQQMLSNDGKVIIVSEVSLLTGLFGWLVAYDDGGGGRKLLPGEVSHVSVSSTQYSNAL